MSNTNHSSEPTEPQFLIWLALGLSFFPALLPSRVFHLPSPKNFPVQNLPVPILRIFPLNLVYRSGVWRVRGIKNDKVKKSGQENFGQEDEDRSIQYDHAAMPSVSDHEFAGGGATNLPPPVIKDLPSRNQDVTTTCYSPEFNRLKPILIAASVDFSDADDNSLLGSKQR